MNFQQTYQLHSSPILRNRLRNCEILRMEDRASAYNSPPYKTVTNELESFRINRFKKENQVINGTPMQSYPKLEYLRNWKPL